MPDAPPFTSAALPAIAARRYDTGEPVRISVVGERIASIDPAWPDRDIATWPFVAPGLFDLQVNGYGGIWFSNSTLSDSQAVAALRPWYARGVTRLCPTLITNSFDALATGLAAIRAACEQDPQVNRQVAGCHLEGPWLSDQDGPRGAHPRQHIRPADWNEFCHLQEISGNRIRLTTIAPEVAGAVDFIGRATANGVRVAIGHTAASAAQINAAVEAGARLSTHLGNGAHPQLKRHPNYIWDQLGDERLHASVISDGDHLPASVLRSLIRAKSARQVIITCDASGWAGCPPGIYENELGKVEVLGDGRIVVFGQHQLLAGSGRFTDQCVAAARRLAGLSLATAIDMASGQPARFLGVEEAMLRRGGLADFFVYDDDIAAGELKIRATVAAGRLVYGELPEVDA